MGTTVDLLRILVIKLSFLLYENGIVLVHAEVEDENLGIVVEKEEVDLRRVLLDLIYLRDLLLLTLR